MNSSGCSEKSSKIPRGAEFHLCALQVNPHHYNETFRGKETAGDVESHAKAIVAKAVEIGVSVLAITDHNNVSGVEAFRTWSKERTASSYACGRNPNADDPEILHLGS